MVETLSNHPFREAEDSWIQLNAMYFDNSEYGEIGFVPLNIFQATGIEDDMLETAEGFLRSALKAPSASRRKLYTVLKDPYSQEQITEKGSAV